MAALVENKDSSICDNDSQLNIVYEDLPKTLFIKNVNVNGNGNGNNPRVKKIKLTITYIIMAHGAVGEKIFNEYHDITVRHISTAGTTLTTKIYNCGTKKKIPVLNGVCDNHSILDKTIETDLKFTSSKSTNEYDGVFLCIEDKAARIYHFEIGKPYDLSFVVGKIKLYHDLYYKDHVCFIGVLSCLKIQGQESTKVSGNAIVGPKHVDQCRSLGLKDSVLIDTDFSGGKYKKRNHTRKRMRSKKTTQKYRRRR